MSKKPEVRLPRMPTAEEEKPGPEMQGYIHQEILLIPEMEKYVTTHYLITNHEPVWMPNKRDSGHGQTITCHNYPQDITATFFMMEKLVIIRPDLYEELINRLNKVGWGLAPLFCFGSIHAAKWICISLIQATKKMVMEAEASKNKK